MLVFNHLFGFNALDAGTPLGTFVFLVALGVDYNIFLMTRVREETVKLGTREGMLHALAVTGGVITSAGLVLAGTSRCSPCCPWWCSPSSASSSPSGCCLPHVRGAHRAGAGPHAVARPARVVAELPDGARARARGSSRAWWRPARTRASPP